ncbi:hypothetical protein T09_740 [Trichinella sp. T9]|nr:hypothetical protein T09_740 [Trichinella sp. T9]
MKQIFRTCHADLDHQPASQLVSKQAASTSRAGIRSRQHFNKFAKVGRSFNKFPIYISTAVDHFQSCAQHASTGQCMSNIPNGRTDTDACVPLVSSSSSGDGGGNLPPIGLGDSWPLDHYHLYPLSNNFQSYATNRLAPLSPKLHTWYDDTGSRRTTPAHLEENLIVSLPKAYLAICKKRRHIPYSCKLRLLQADIVFQAHTKETHTNKRLAKRMLSRQSRFQIFTQLDQLYNERTPNLELDSQGRLTIGFLKSRQKLANGQRRAGRCSLVGANCSPARAAPRVIEPKKTSRPELSLPQLHGSMPGRCLHNLTTIDATIFDEHLKCSNYPRPLSIYYSLCMPRTVQAAVALQSPSKHARVRANGVAAAWKPVASVDRQR